jgi:hypothetical protein
MNAAYAQVGGDTLAQTRPTGRLARHIIRYTTGHKVRLISSVCDQRNFLEWHESILVRIARYYVHDRDGQPFLVLCNLT